MSQPIVPLTCCCCGERTRGRQWHNRDTGFGLCVRCVDWILGRGKLDSEEFHRCYGLRDYHYGEVTEASDFPTCMVCGAEQTGGKPAPSYCEVCGHRVEVSLRCCDCRKCWAEALRIMGGVILPEKGRWVD